MRRRLRTIAFGAASMATLVGGAAWLVIIARAEAARHLEMRIDSGETITIEYEADDPYDFSSQERATIAEVARRTFPEVRRVLPGTPTSLDLRVSSAPPDKVMPETGDAASNSQPNIVRWRVDPSRRGGVSAIAGSLLRQTLFHEIHHIVRTAEIFDQDLRGDIVREGLATAFERDFAGTSPAWGQYPADVDVWTREVLALSDEASRDVRDAWLFHAPDGRRWVGMRVGTYLVDRAMRSSGRTSADLVRAPPATIIKMALGDAPSDAP